MLLFILKRNGIISSYQLEKKNERNLTFLLLVLIFGIFVYQISKYSFPYLAVNYGIAILVSTASMWLINYKSKLSFHGIGAASLVALTSFVMVYESTNSVLPFLIISILLSGVIGSARLYLSAHKPFELYLGYGIGFIITLATLWISTTIV
jgi:membrane-associated phospholipid phosphatase